VKASIGSGSRRKSGKNKPLHNPTFAGKTIMSLINAVYGDETGKEKPPFLGAFDTLSGDSMLASTL
jgi:hypothetical protein